MAKSTGGPGGSGDGPGTSFERAGLLVTPGRAVGELIPNRPTGTTGHQWSAATRSRFDLVVRQAATGALSFAVDFADPAASTPASRRVRRARSAVCAAVGLSSVTVESTTLTAAVHGQRIVEYLIDARAFLDPATESPGAVPAFRDIVGRLPDGRTGHVNDLGALARAHAVEAYVERRLVDPIVRGLRVRWADGPAEGWGWVEVRPGRFLIERVRVHFHRFACGVDADRLAEDLAVMAVGQRLRGSEPFDADLGEAAALNLALGELRGRRHEMVGGFRFDHVSFG